MAPRPCRHQTRLAKPTLITTVHWIAVLRHSEQKAQRNNPMVAYEVTGIFPFQLQLCLHTFGRGLAFSATI